MSQEKQYVKYQWDKPTPVHKTGNTELVRNLLDDLSRVTESIPGCYPLSQLGQRVYSPNIGLVVTGSPIEDGDQMVELQQMYLVGAAIVNHAVNLVSGRQTTLLQVDNRFFEQSVIDVLQSYYQSIEPMIEERNPEDSTRGSFITKP